MKRWIILAGLLLAAVAAGDRTFRGTDVSELQPVEVLRIDCRGGIVWAQTDTGQSGRGSTLEAAFEDLKKTTPGTVFLDTAQWVIVTEESKPLVDALFDYLRPACKICQSRGDEDLTAAAEYLTVQDSRTTLLDCRAKNEQIPLLLVKDGRMYLVSEGNT